eukprot:CAMPEP_0198554922 /NCGR_PEP_ID=MMETSP1462-20131121/83644_1 /TAXON_ID=1333877 /ORGANISM="Brandtodinium nutriculum, Strain RCC3387" /LENGTH=129 /DNA_ID=CAMNT_0044285645 /DNA_START=39 /DNA_END=424 /DNA_ORIENTATION=-
MPQMHTHASRSPRAQVGQEGAARVAAIGAEPPNDAVSAADKVPEKVQGAPEAITEGVPTPPEQRAERSPDAPDAVPAPRQFGEQGPRAAANFTAALADRMPARMREIEHRGASVADESAHGRPASADVV